VERALVSSDVNYDVQCSNDRDEIYLNNFPHLTGDSGSGLQCKLNRNGPWILVGITSFGSGCAKEGYADVFTNVAYYRKWIDNVIKSN
jgi:hypothetical protein